ncbi:MAG TPA: threonine--tRNA ligase, partial [Planctomycetota bacterium]|nr:threonine--tRNA ligase [Planctomycetota bacterium]
CPFHVLIFKSQSRSYRELPMRLSELGTVYRYERAGTLHGLLRARGLTQDDSHVICTEDQLIDEILAVFELTLEIHRTFGFVDPVVTLSTKPGLAIGDEAMWSKAIEALTHALERSGLAYEVADGEGAFYGPKVDFHFRDAIGRLWQLTTVQCDFALPERFEMEYVGQDNERHRPVMIHRAILGSLERFIGILIEQCAGNFPFWIAPVQARVLSISQNHVAYAREVADLLRKAGYRVEVDDTDQRIGGKVREARLQRIPYLLTVGDREVADRKAAVRERPEKDLGAMSLEALLDFFAELERSKK